MRIDLWGDEVDRLSEFSVHDQRSTTDVAEADIFPARELLPTDEVRERAAALVAAEPWGREQWERLAEGLVFDGMESWMPWLTQGEHTLVDLLDASAQIVLVEPRRMRDRASEILAEEADLAGSSVEDMGCVRRRVPAAARAVRRPPRRHARRRVDVPAGRRPTGRSVDRGDGMGADLGRRRRPRPPVGRAAG